MAGLANLKALMAKRKEKADSLKATGRSWVRKGDLEENRVQDYLKDKLECDRKRVESENDQLRRFDAFLSRKSTGTKAVAEAQAKAVQEEKVKAIAQLALLMDEPDDADPPLGVLEVFERLRERLEPVTLFGETDMQRYKRLRRAEIQEMNQEFVKKGQDGVAEPGVREVWMPPSEDAQQDPQSTLIDFNLDGGAAGTQPPAAAAAAAGGGNDVPMGTDEHAAPAGGDGGGAAGAPENDEQSSEEEDEMKKLANELKDVRRGLGKDQVNDADLDPEVVTKMEKIRQWTRAALKLWEKVLMDRDEVAKKNAVGKAELAQYRQSKRDLKPLVKRLKSRSLQAELMESLFHMIELIDDREYRKANEVYIQLSVGNATWPSRIGMRWDNDGRRGKSLQSSESCSANIAHALNDETTRKFIQTTKRLLTFIQKLLPTDPSRMAPA